jgi:hypothetical protein
VRCDRGHGGGHGGRGGRERLPGRHLQTGTPCPWPPPAPASRRC